MNRIDEIRKTAKEPFKKIIEECEESTVRCISHNDADGICSAGIIAKALVREGVPFLMSCIRQLTEDFIKSLKNEQYKYFLFTDLGSGQLNFIEKYLLDKSKVIVIDHHVPFENENENLDHLNAHLFSIDGAREISGSGMSYAFVTALGKNRDLSGVAIVGALGDLQDMSGSLHGVNREILEEAKKEGIIKVERDIRLFGRYTRPLYKSLQYTINPYIPGISSNINGVSELLKELEIPHSVNGKARRIVDLSSDEKQRLASALIQRLLRAGASPEIAESIVGENYTFVNEPEDSELKDAKEYATLLNSCGKHKRADIGIAIIVGDRGALEEARNLVEEHKNTIVEGLKWLYENPLKIKRSDVLQWFNVERDVDDSIIGTVAMMGMGANILDRSIPVVAIAKMDENMYKVSARGTREMVDRNVDLAEAVRVAAKKVGGEGGGHDVAAGAVIPAGKEEEFIKFVETIIRRQLGEGKS